VGPRLSISGGEKDPLQLLAEDSSSDNEDDSDSVEIGMCLQDRLAAKSRFKKLSENVAASQPEEPVMLDFTGCESSSDDSYHASARAPARPLAPPLAPSCRNTPLAPSAKPSSFVFQYDDESSDSSLQAMRKVLQPRRNEKLRLDSSDDDESLDGKPAARKGPSVGINPTKRAPTNRKQAARVDKEQKEQDKREKAEQRQLERSEKQAVKQLEKETRALQRKHKQVVNQAAKHAEKNTKKRRREEAGQATGKFAPKEIAVLLERDLFRHQQWDLVEQVQEAGFLVHEYPSALGCKAVQWIRKDYLEGGGDDAVQMLYVGNVAGYEHLPVLAIVFDVPQDFIQLLDRDAPHDEEDDYPELENWLYGIQVGWRAAWNAPENKRPRIILLLHNVFDALDGMWVNHRKQNRKDDPSPPTAETLHDAITWMLIQFQVECILCNTAQDVSHTINKMTRLLSERPYIRQVTELECIKKIKANCSDMDLPYERSKECWLRQLQQVPRISLQKARNLTRHYPTARSLWEMYQRDDLTEDEKRVLVADLFDQSSRQVKLSDWLYRVMTSMDPEEILR